jgi:chromosome segregation ATPase
MLNPTQQQSKIAKKIFEKVDEYKDWSIRVEKAIQEYNESKEKTKTLRDEYMALENGFEGHKNSLNNEINSIKSTLEKLYKEEDDKIQSIKDLSIKVFDRQKEFEEFKEEIFVAEKDLTDKINGIEAELVEMERKKEEKMKEIDAIQLEARLATVSYEQLKEETEKLAKKLLEMKDHIADLERRENDMAIRELRLQRLKKEVIKK